MLGKGEELMKDLSLAPSVPTPEEEALVQRGYRLTRRDHFLGVPFAFHYTKDIDVSDDLRFLAKEALDKVYSYLSLLEPSSSKGRYEVFGSFRATLFPSGNGLIGAFYSYSYSFVSSVGSDHLPSWFSIDVRGSMDGPHPEGVPQDFTLGSRIYVPVHSKARRSDIASYVPRWERSRFLKSEEAESMLYSLLDSFRDERDFLMSSEVYLVSGDPLPRKGGEGGEEGGKSYSPAYLYIGTVGDLLSGLLGDQEEEYLEEEEWKEGGEE